MVSRKNFLFALFVMAACVAVITFTTSDLFTREAAKRKPYTGNEEHAITLAEASEMTARFRAQAGSDPIIGGYFGRDAVMQILTQEGTVGLRYYYGLDDNGLQHLILVGVNQEGEDMTNGFLAERNFLCPPLCSDPNKLNASQEEIELAAGQ